MELLTTPYHFPNHFFPFSLQYRLLLQNLLVSNLAVVKLLSPERSQTAKDHHTLTLMSAKGEEIKSMVPCDNWQSYIEMALETVELPTRKQSSFAQCN